MTERERIAEALEQKCFFDTNGIGCGDECGKCIYCQAAALLRAEPVGEPVAFNINYMVRARLTDRGRKLMPEDYPLHEDADGWSEWQLWELMSVLGEHCYMGPTPPFETTIMLVPPKAVALPSAPTEGGGPEPFPAWKLLDPDGNASTRWLRDKLKSTGWHVPGYIAEQDRVSPVSAAGEPTITPCDDEGHPLPIHAFDSACGISHPMAGGSGANVSGSAAGEEERKYPCAKCGKLRNRAEGGTTFTVCDACWSTLYPAEPATHTGDVEGQDALSKAYDTGYEMGLRARPSDVEKLGARLESIAETWPSPYEGEGDVDILIMSEVRPLLAALAARSQGESQE